MASSFGLSLASLIGPIRLMYQLDMMIVFGFPLLCLVIGVTVWRRNRPEARFYVLSQAASCIGLVIFGLLIEGVLPFRQLFFESVSIGISGDALLLSLALADRIRILQRAKRQAEEEALKNLALRREELELVVAQRTSELETARKHAELLATTDPLTGIFNRRGLLERAERDWQLSLRTGRSLSVVIFDLDHFKTINDRYGHAEGDRVLRQVAAVVSRSIRVTDLFGRIGGEEFLLIMPETMEEGAARVAERIRLRLAAEVHSGEPPTPITASFGVASMAQRGINLDSLQTTADSVLYRAKRNGRNRVEVGGVLV